MVRSKKDPASTEKASRWKGSRGVSKWVYHFQNTATLNNRLTEGPVVGTRGVGCWWHAAKTLLQMKTGIVAPVPRYVSDIGDPQEWFIDERLYAADDLNVVADPAPWTHSEVKRPVPVGVGMPPFPCCVTVRDARNTAAIFERFAVSAAIVYTGNGRIGHFFTIEPTEDELGTNVTIHDMFDEQRGRPFLFFLERER
jgi:hypothetical protein